MERLREATRRDARLLEGARRRSEEHLAGRTVWCIAALPGGRKDAWTLRACLREGDAEGGTAVHCLEITATEPLAGLGQRLQAMLVGSAGSSRGLSRADAATYAEGCLDGEATIGGSVRADDVVVLHDALAAVTAEAARERGAHVVWRIDARVAPARAPALDAWDFMRPQARGVDGYVGEWILSDFAPKRIGAVVPSTGTVAAHDVGPRHARVGWTTALAELVQADRHETVGGTVHARPAVAVR